MEIYEMLLDRLTPFLTGHGFRRFGNAFYRLYNNEMLQAITVDWQSPQKICWGSEPYWCFDIATAGNDSVGFNNNWWIMDKVKIKKELPNEELTEADIQDISPWTDTIENEVFDVMCRVSTFVQYVDEEVDFLRKTRIVRGTSGIVNKYLLAYRTYLTGSFDYMKDYMELYNDCLRDELEKAKSRYDPDDITDWPGVYRYRLEHGFEFEKQKIAENDLDWIVPVKEEMSAKMRSRMREELGLEIPE